MAWSDWKRFGNDIKFIGSNYFRVANAAGSKIFDASRNTFLSESECDNFKFAKSTNAISVTIKKAGVYDIIGFGNGSERYKLINAEIEAGQTFNVPCGSTATTEGYLIVNSYE